MSYINTFKLIQCLIERKTLDTKVFLEEVDENKIRLMLGFRVLFDKQVKQGMKQSFATLAGIMNKFEKAKI